MSLEQFRCVAVLGRGHFGKVGFVHLNCVFSLFNVHRLELFPLDTSS